VYDRIDLIDWFGLFFLFAKSSSHHLSFFSLYHPSHEFGRKIHLIFHLAFPRHVTYLSTLVTFDTSSVLTDVDGGRTLTSHMSVTLAFKTPAFRGAIAGDMTKALASMTLLATTTPHRTHGISPSSTKTAAEATSTTTASTHAYGIGAITGDVPVFFTVVTIFDGSIFTSFGWFRALAGDVTVDPAVVAYCAVRTVARYVTLFGALVTKTILRHDCVWNNYGSQQILYNIYEVFF